MRLAAGDPWAGRRSRRHRHRREGRPRWFALGLGTLVPALSGAPVCLLAYFGLGSVGAAVGGGGGVLWAAFVISCLRGTVNSGVLFFFFLFFLL